MYNLLSTCKAETKVNESFEAVQVKGCYQGRGSVTLDVDPGHRRATRSIDREGPEHCFGYADDVIIASGKVEITLLWSAKKKRHYNHEKMKHGCGVGYKSNENHLSVIYQDKGAPQPESHQFGWNIIRKQNIYG